MEPIERSEKCIHFLPRSRHARGGKSGPFGVLLSFGLVVSAAVVEAAGTFYVDIQNPQASDAGLGTEARPFRTISGAIAIQHGPGVTIVVKPGAYREEVSIPASGSSSSPFVLRAAGPGVILDGADDLATPSRWIQYGGPVWVAPSVSWAPNQVFADGVRLEAATSTPAGLPAGSFRYIAGSGLYVNVGDGNPGSHGLMVGRRTSGFRVSSKSWVTIEGFHVTRFEDRGFELVNGTSVALIGNRVSFAFRHGVKADSGAANLIEGNVVSDNGDHGIALTSGATGCTVRGNESFRNARPGERAANGIYLFGAPGNLLTANRLHDNQDSGIHFGAGANNTISSLNRSWNNGDHGFDHLYATGTIHVCDVAYANYKDGFSIEGYATGTHIHNCIAVDNGLQADEYDLWVDPNSVAGFESDYNIFWNSTSQPPVKFGNTHYSTIAAYRTASGMDDHSTQGDPRFVDPAAGDFHLGAGSPAIDSGDSGTPGWPALDAAGNSPFDEGAIANSGDGPVTFADRGALEFAPDRAPVVVVPTDVNGSEGDPLTLYVSASDPDGDAIASLTAAGLPPGCSFTAGADHQTGMLLWTPAAGQSGTYGITFTADNALTGSATTTIDVRVVIPNLPPSAVLDATPTSGGELLLVTADASSSSDGDGAIVSYVFDFGDGTLVGPVTSPVATHTYARGQWTLQVTVTDDDGATSVADTVISVGEAVGLPNLVANPSFEVNLAGWNSYSGAAVARVSGGHDGGYCAEVVGPSSLTAFGINDSPNWVARTGAADQRYRITAWVRSGSSAGICKLYIREYQGATRLGVVYSPAVTLSSTWQELTVDYTCRGAGTTLDLQVADFPVAAGESFQVDEVSIYNLSGGGSGGGVPNGRPRPLHASITPVPARANALLSFQTTQPGSLQVELFDIGGRRVREMLRENNAPAGLYELPVHGDNGRGDLSAGTYFFRIRAEEGTTTGRIVIVK